MNEHLYMILSCLNHMSENHFYGTEILVDILQGTQNDILQKNGLHNIPEYGKFSDISRENISYMVEWLIEKKFILQTKGRYPVLHPTYNGLHYSEIMTDALIRQLIKELNTQELILR